MRSITHDTFANRAHLRVESAREGSEVRSPSSTRAESLMLRWAAIGFCAAFWAGVAALFF